MMIRYLLLSLILPFTAYGQDSAFLPVTSLPVFHKSGFVLAYNEPTETAQYVAYELTRLEAITPSSGSRPSFRIDRDIPTGSARTTDYTNSGYDRGHLAPAADMDYSQESLNDSMLMSNIAPMLPSYNRGIWKSLETKVRRWAEERGVIYVITGPIYVEEEELRIEIGTHEVGIPFAFYKIIYDPGMKESLTYIIPQLPPYDKPLSEYIRSIDDLEGLLDIDFFPGLPHEDELEAKSIWTIQ